MYPHATAIFNALAVHLCAATTKVIGSYKSGEHSGVGASHGGVDPLGEKGLGGVTDFFSMKGWQIISAAR